MATKKGGLPQLTEQDLRGDALRLNRNFQLIAEEIAGVKAGSISGGVTGATGPAGARGASGPTGPSGTAGTPAPNVTSAFAVPFYDRIGDAYRFGFEGEISLPVSDPDYSHLVEIAVVGVDPSGRMVEIGRYAPGIGPVLTFAGIVDWQPDTTQTWPEIQFRVYNENGAVSANPFIWANATVEASFALAVNAAEAPDSVYLDSEEGLHFEIFIGGLLSSPIYPVPVTAWLDADDGKGWINQGVFSATSSVIAVTLGQATATTEGVRYAGDIWVPTDPTQTSWKVAIKAGKYSDATPVAGYVFNTFTVTPAGPPTVHDITNAVFIADPGTGDILDYAGDGIGSPYWQYFEIDWTQPPFAASPYYEFSFITSQKGYAASGVLNVSGGVGTWVSGSQFNVGQFGFDIHVDGALYKIGAVTSPTSIGITPAPPNGTNLTFEIWNEAPDYEGQDDAKGFGVYKGRQFSDTGVIQGGTSIPGSTAMLPGPHPPTWTYPPDSNPDGTANLYRTYRFRIYAVSRLSQNVNGSSGSTVLQQCWAGASDHFDVTPNAVPNHIDLRHINPTTSFHPGSPFAGGGGSKLDIHTAGPISVIANAIDMANQVITNQYLAPLAVQALNMAASSVTAANGALAANSVVDGNVFSVGVAKLISGTNIFTGDVFLSRGTGNPVLALKNTGIWLFGAADGTGAAGLLSQPYVSVQNTGILVASGSDPSVSVTPGNIILYGKNGDLTKPYVAVNNLAMQLYNGNFKTDITAAQIKLSYTLGGSLVLDSSKITLQNGAYSVVVFPTSVLMQVAGGPSMGLSATDIQMVNGAYSIDISASQILMTNGTFSMTLSASQLLFAVSGGSQLKLSATQVKLQADSTGASSITLDSLGNALFTYLSTSTTINGNVITTGELNAVQYVGAGGPFIVPFLLTCQSFATANAGASTLPSNPVGFFEVGINGTIRKVPYYAV